MRTLYEPIYPGVYVPWGHTPSAVDRAKAAWLWSRRQGVIAGTSAAAVLGARWIDGREPAELIHDNRRPPPGIVVRSEMLANDELQHVDGMARTSPARTAFDIGRHTVSRLRAVQRLDALVGATDVKPVNVESLIAAHPHARGLGRLRAVLPLVDGGAESPQETFARLVLIDSGLPAPQTQIRIYDEYGLFIARVDMAYEEVKVGIEYDGPQHWTDPAVRQRDIDKQVEFRDCGWHVVRVSRDLLYHRRSTYVHRVATVLRERGFFW